MNVKLARIKAGLTQKELAALVGISNVTIVKIEKGNYDSITRATMIKIAKVLNSNVTELFFSEEEWEKAKLHFQNISKIVFVTFDENKSYLNDTTE